MKNIFDVYKNKLDEFIVSLKSKIKQQPISKELLEDIRREINQWGKNNLNLMFLELKSALEKKAVNEEKKKNILERAESLTQYGLYVAPIDLIQQDDVNTKSVYVGLGTLIASSIVQKALFKKFKFLNSILIGTVVYIVAKNYFGNNQNTTEVVMSYIDDAKDWLFSAFENIYKTFEELA